MVSDASCPDDLPSGCSDAAPSFQREVFPIISRRCSTCHRAGGIEPSRPYTNYDQVSVQAHDVLIQVYGCKMPPSCVAQPTSDEREALLQWLVCRAPNN